ncbi:ubiquitin-conjugating enzyme E2 U-like [Physella acuta]|uniref:ubiquitin-conjugating enzyme E2 U-like n=1 Tax=Physella acuta TaxID=109671 RepID=UPI0027DC4FD0|nr:ubiquitin-conjugating enzyme E2 U-like [Physella acuta]
MYSRAHLLIERDINQFNKETPWGCEIYPLKDDSVFELLAKVKGLRNTKWEGGIFKIYIHFDEHYNMKPPEIYFQTIPFHPNVDASSGKPSIDFLDYPQKWNENYSLSNILVALQALLSHPVLENAVNTQAAQMLMVAPLSYEQMVQECVAASQKVEDGKDPHETTLQAVAKLEKTAGKNMTSQSAKRPSSHSTRLSFNDYHTTWCNIATSKTRYESVNPLLDQLKENEKLHEIHLGLQRNEIEEQIKKHIDDHNTLMYGVFKHKPSNETLKAAKLAQLEKMKRLYLPPRQTPNPEFTHNEAKVLVSEETWEKEVDELVNWTNNLNTNFIDAT